MVNKKAKSLTMRIIDNDIKVHPEDYGKKPSRKLKLKGQWSFIKDLEIHKMNILLISPKISLDMRDVCI
jgi:hypothetical protein